MADVRKSERTEEMVHVHGMGLRQMARRLVLASAVVLSVSPVHAQDAVTEPAAETSTANAPTATLEKPLEVELNKLATTSNRCEAYVVVNNPNAFAIDKLLVEMIMFRTDGVIGNRFAVNLAPLRKTKRTVKVFPVPGVQCDEIGSFLINDVMECRTGASDIDDCISGLNLSALTKAGFMK